MNRTLLGTITDAIIRLQKERGYTFCVIEHDMDMIRKLCDPVVVMAEGRVLAQGTAEGDVQRAGYRGLSRNRSQKQAEERGRRVSALIGQDMTGGYGRGGTAIRTLVRLYWPTLKSGGRFLGAKGRQWIFSMPSCFSATLLVSQLWPMAASLRLVLWA